MLRNIVFSLVLVFAGKILLAQDTIYKVNRDVVVATVLEVGTSEIKYKRYSAPNGPLYTVRKSEVWKITYADGATEFFTVPKPPASSDFTGRRWMVGLNAFDLMFGMVTVTGELAMKKNNLSVRVPLSVGVSAFDASIENYGYPDFYYYNRFKTFSTGIQGLLYPAGQQHLVSYYLGLSGEYGQVKARSYPSYPYQQPQTITTYWYVGLGVMNGILIQASDRVNVSIDATAGMITNDSHRFNYRAMGRLGITMSWRLGKLITPENTPSG